MEFILYLIGHFFTFSKGYIESQNHPSPIPHPQETTSRNAIFKADYEVNGELYFGQTLVDLQKWSNQPVIRISCYFTEQNPAPLLP